MTRGTGWVSRGVVGITALMSPAVAMAAQGRIMIPAVSGRAEAIVFTGHPGWVDVFGKGYGKSASARIAEDGTFEIVEPKGAQCLIAMFDKIETPPVILPRWPREAGNYDVPIPAEYACVPAGYPNVGEAFAKVRGHSVFQEIVPKCTQLYGVSFFDGPKVADWGSELTVMLHENEPKPVPIALKEQSSSDPGWQGKVDRVSTQRGEHEVLRMGWRHGNMPVVPGRKYVVQVEGYRSHSGKNYRLNGYVRPDHGDGYPGGRALVDQQRQDGDLCCLVFGNGHGQLVENYICDEEWEIFIPRHRPTKDWGQSFVSHGVSLAGISFWAGTDGQGPVTCEVRVREEGPWGKMLKPAKVARGHESPARPVIRYPEIPPPLPEYEAYYKLPSQLFQVAYMPDELRLAPNKTYYIEVIPTRPIMMYADGNFYQKGHAYYEGLKVTRQRVGHTIFHSTRWTLAMNIVTYAKPNGEPMAPAK